jgi:hypothetical protein
MNVSELRDILKYDPLTGQWTWIKHVQGRRFVGKEAGSIDVHGYRIIKIDHKQYKSARLAYFYMTGEWPQHEMDHKDRVRSNDRWRNLRPATRMQNAKNLRQRRDLIGVYPHNSGWKAVISVDGKLKYLGMFPTSQEASRARDAAAVKFHKEFAVLTA